MNKRVWWADGIDGLHTQTDDFHICAIGRARVYRAGACKCSQSPFGLIALALGARITISAEEYTKQVPVKHTEVIIFMRDKRFTLL